MVKRKGFPSVGEKTIVSVIRITPYSALCNLEEYPGVEGMIHISEVSGKWVRDIRKFIKMNKTYVVKVLRVDERKGHVNLSIKRVSRIERTKKMAEFKREQKAEKILEKIAKKQKMTLDKAYEQIGYELQDKFGEMFEAFDLAAKSSDFLIKKGIPKKWADKIHKIAKENIVRKKVKIKAELNVRFFTGDGVDRTKKFLNDITNKYGVNIKYISAPKYSVEVETENPKITQKELTKNLKTAVSSIKDGEASFNIRGEK
jgi:translation initiation factor 2 subunit 1